MLLFISAANLHAQNQELYSWGYNSNGQLGNNTTANTSSPGQIGSNVNWAFVSCGSRYTLAISTDGSLYAWGNNGSGQLGDGTQQNRSTPVLIGTGYVSVACGAQHTLAIKTDGSLWAWGHNAYGQLGINNAIWQYSPTRVGNDVDWSSVACGDYHSLAIKNDGSLWAWGRNSLGQLGIHSTTSQSVPTRVGYDYNWASISAGDNHTVAIKTNGGLYAWGHNAYGQLGDNSTDTRLWPVQIGQDLNWATVSCGLYHTLAIRNDGSLWAWGNGSYGQLGIGSTPSAQLYTERVGNESNWASVACGDYHSLAIKTNGTLWAWGNDYAGQMGDGNTQQNDRYSPGQVGTATDWGAIAAGYAHSVARSSACAPLTPAITSSPAIPVNPGGEVNTIYRGYGPQSVTLSASGGTSYTWSPATGLSCTDCANPTASPASTTTYTVTATDASSCSGQASITITVVDIVCGNNPTKVLICHQCNNAQTVCIGESSVAAHLAHGDYLGECRAAQKPGIGAAPIPTEVMLEQNYPNPFNPTTTIRYALPAHGVVTLRVYDHIGRIVAELENGMRDAGSHAVEFDAGRLVSGVYLVRLQALGQIRTGTMTLMK
ncbi:MAG: T9SS type A sorting domain-containing protein [Ignavibacteriae bacterium]|nr:T9SS type A sorting domain-containing protein [Ignavibacteriota bacterium]